MTPARTICLGFLLVIGVGTLLLWLPLSTQAPGWNSLLTALFTSTSAVCVTGLSVVDVGTYYSFWGQLILVLLVQIGGLGYMTSMTLLMLLLGRRFRLKDKLAVQQALDQTGMGGVKNLLRSILIATAAIEVLGVLALLPIFTPKFGFWGGLWHSIFHSINSFNNAGFSLFANSFMNYFNSPLLVVTTTGLILLGGIGYQVLLEFYLRFTSKYPDRFAFSLNTKVAVSTTLVLLGMGTVAFWLIEANNPATLGGMNWGERVLAAWFQAVTPRTAGFNTIDIGQMTATGLFFTIVLMFIGASPGGTGGGIKTTTLRVLVRATRAILRGHEEVIIYEREIPPTLIYKAIGVLIGSMSLVLLILSLVSITETEQGFTFLQLFFEVVSAFATVGLSTGITGGLTLSGKLLIILTMYAGRVGVLLLMAALFREPRPLRTHYPEETFLVG
ncbi:TrkH family potassium uptake protein [Gloeomargarita lithophora Alchichica-D10]|uniref:TrkH family potassium uptake protein n=1 Tax=Gloeomargarita lithophora Alchichica-D10 TaxID=1188229 RepID=A0A1J0AGX0_9CYAN|nr:TrkH family potassium uptake protein [Gloeomargarita lithophora]APB35144.1 TrkH family potassium uptake protein [Gloeomargarita lithophora Alchichica-D10]